MGRKNISASLRWSVFARDGFTSMLVPRVALPLRRRHNRGRGASAYNSDHIPGRFLADSFCGCASCNPKKRAGDHRGSCGIFGTSASRFRGHCSTDCHPCGGGQLPDSRNLRTAATTEIKLAPADGPASAWPCRPSMRSVSPPSQQPYEYPLDSSRDDSVSSEDSSNHYSLECQRCNKKKTGGLE